MAAQIVANEHFRPISPGIFCTELISSSVQESKYERWKTLLRANDYPSYRYDQLLHSIFVEGIWDFDRMSTLPRHLRELLKADCRLSVVPITDRMSHQAQKVLFQLSDNERVEAVRLHYRKHWQALCISSQCGCGMACPFCATGAIGLRRNLTSDEITDQVLYFRLKGYKVESVSFMGMGEPLANPQIFTAIETLTNHDLFAFSQRRLTVSTVGLLPALSKLLERFPQVNVVFSLHSPFSDQRNDLVPMNRRFSIAEVMEILDSHIRCARRQISIAYILIRDVNDSLSHAEAVAALIRSREVPRHLYHVNLIPYNHATGIVPAYAPPRRASVDQFCQLLKRRGIRVTIRPSFGVDIDAACGQLHGLYDDECYRHFRVNGRLDHLCNEV